MGTKMIACAATNPPNAAYWAASDVADAAAELASQLTMTNAPSTSSQFTLSMPRAIVGAVLFGFHLGTWFSVAMVGLAGAAILRDTSNVILHFPEDRYVAAALQLFASVALMFWYVLRLLMGERR